ncbi:hypothetical protein K443DRAFT_682291 [Laccaria amethystina LaAM-08-1]|uniref:Uncharacterized protein n=1 Tax=Laccaria amethystina LaAM-08-1 TaxID=1095629 RepID=A0A0C9WVK4_9AGAR|nr:hypothetical protein K443DRAFT_682291 [Laccaria amethystina LaAM-08-1]
MLLRTAILLHFGLHKFASSRCIQWTENKTRGWLDVVQRAGARFGFIKLIMNGTWVYPEETEPTLLDAIF